MILASIQTEIIPNAGLELQSVLRGILGLIVLLAIAIACSANRKNISWKTVGIGLLIQFMHPVKMFHFSKVELKFQKQMNLYQNYLYQIVLRLFHLD